MSLESINWQLLHREGICSFPLPQHRLIFIGCEECDIILQSPGIEKRHAVLSYDEEKHNFYIKDLNSMTGTYINDVKIPEQSYCKLNQNDEIRFGYGAYFTLNKKNLESPVTNQSQEAEPSTAVDTYEILEADSLEDLKEDVFNHDQHEVNREMQITVAANMQERRDDLTLPFGRPSHKICPLSNQVIINYNTAAQSPDRKSDDLSSKTNGSMDSSDSSAGTMTLTACQQQPAAMAFTIPFDGLATPKPFTRKKPRLKEGRTRSPLPTDGGRGTRKLRASNMSSSDDHSSETEQYRQDDIRKQDEDNDHADASSDSSGQAPFSDTTSYLIQRMLDGSTPQTAKWAGKRSPDGTAPWSTKKANGDAGASSLPKWSRSKTLDVDHHPPLCSPSQAKWAGRRTPDQPLPTLPAKLASTKKTPEDVLTFKWEDRKSSSPPVPCTAKDKDMDEKSETGTYTVDKELEDPAVEEARNRIDQVFGVSEKIPDSVFIKNDQISSSSPSENDIHQSAFEVRQSKQPITTPPVEKSSFDFIPFNDIMTTSAPNLYGNSYRTRKEVSRHELKAQTPPPHPSPRSNRTSKVESQIKENGSRKMGRSLSNNETGELSDGSPQSTKHAFYGVFPWRRKSWNISCSDLELDHGKVETSSVLSDMSTSTEPSSHSSHSSRSRSGEVVGPQMRLNRAFALRRARLGFESDEPGLNQTKGVQAVRPLPRGASVSQTNLLRQDGGRFSLRLPRNTAVKVNKQLVKPQENKSIVKPFQHQPPANKSYVPVLVRKAAVPAPSAEVEALQAVGHPCPKKEVSALDSLVISAIQQLSVKLKGNACQMLERERKRYPENSDTRLMIEEILPQMMDKRPPDIASEGNLTKDLSIILKNLKRVEQTLDVFAVLSEQHPPPVPPTSSPESASARVPKPAAKKGFFLVNC